MPKVIVGRPKGDREPRDVNYTVKLTESALAKLRNRREETDVPVSTQIFRAIERELDAAEPDPPAHPYIPLLGDIPAGPAADVNPTSPEQYIRPPFYDLPEDCYALEINGNSMESEFGMSVPNGFYAFFAPDVIFPHAIVHVEFSDGEFQHKATLKKYVPKGNGTTEFRPLNKNHKPIVVKDECFTIKGGFIKAWDGISEG